MTTKIEDYNELLDEVSTLNNEHNKLQGRKEQLYTDLKKLGYGTLKEAETNLIKLTEESNNLKNEIEKMFTEASKIVNVIHNK